MNTTLGIGGLFDLAGDHYGLPYHEEDAGQTFAVWGVGDGPYLVLPLFGPSNIRRSEEHTSELQSLMRISYAVFCLTKKNTTTPPSLRIHVLAYQQRKTPPIS